MSNDYNDQGYQPKKSVNYNPIDKSGQKRRIKGFNLKNRMNAAGPSGHNRNKSESMSGYDYKNVFYRANTGTNHDNSFQAGSKIVSWLNFF